MRPYVICHMLSSIDGRIDGVALRNVIGEGEYEATGALLKGDAWVCGRTTMQMHFAEKRTIAPGTRRRVGSPSVHVARRAKTYAVSIDTLGKLRWSGSDIAGDHLICVLSERVSEGYLSMLRKKGISYIVTGKTAVHLAKALNLLSTRFGIKRLLLEGGGHINGAFLEARLIDEVSLLVVPGIDGRSGVPAVFDGIHPAGAKAVSVILKSIRRRRNGTLWIRYKVVRNK